MSENFSDQVSRVEQMCEPKQQTWDLSPNDVAALKALLADWNFLQNFRDDVVSAWELPGHDDHTTISQLDVAFAITSLARKREIANNAD